MLTRHYVRIMRHAIATGREDALTLGQKGGGAQPWKMLNFGATRDSEVGMDTYMHAYEKVIEARVKTLTDDELDALNESADYWRLSPAERDQKDILKRLAKVEAKLGILAR